MRKLNARAAELVTSVKVIDGVRITKFAPAGSKPAKRTMGSATVASRPPQSLRPLRQTVVKHLTQAATIADAALMIIVISTVILALAVNLGAVIEWLRNRRR